MLKRIFFIIFLISFYSNGQELTLKDLDKKTLNNSIRLNFINIQQPASRGDLKPFMGLVGLTYNLPINNWLYTGAGFHTAVNGDQGGLFTLGVTVGANIHIKNNFYFDANLHFGGGGGFRTLVNGGGIYYPNAGFQYKKNRYSFGVQYGYMNFFTGIQKDHNVSFFIEIPSTMRISSYADAQKTFITSNANNDKFWEEPTVKSVQQVTFDFFFPTGMSRTDESTSPPFQPINNTLSVLGFEYQRYLTKNSFVYAHTDAMYNGLVSGFMDVFFGLGKNFISTDKVNFFAKMGIGAAGGRIFPENGLTIYPNAGFDVKLTKQFGVSAHGGYHRSVGGTFEAYTAGFSFKYYGLSGGTFHPFTKEKIDIIETQGIQIAVQNQTYLKVRRFGFENQPEKIFGDLQLIGIKILYDFNNRFYFAGETSFAYEGESGGYAHGVFGIGIKSNKFMNEKLSLFFEPAFGVAGGGGVDSGGGVLIRPTAGINYHINKDFSVNLAGGQMWAPFGNVNSTNINIGLSYGMSILNAKK